MTSYAELSQLMQTGGAETFRAADIGYKQSEVDQQKLELQKLGLSEQMKELKAEQGKAPGLEQMQKRAVPETWNLTGDNIASEINSNAVTANTNKSQGEKYLKQAKYFPPGSADQQRLTDTGRRLIDEAGRIKKDNEKLSKDTVGGLFYALGTADNKDIWDNSIQEFKNSGLPLPQGFKTEFSPENKNKAIAIAKVKDPATATKISNENERKRKAIEAEKKEKDRETKQDAWERMEPLKEALTELKVKETQLQIERLSQTIAKAAKGTEDDAPIKNLPKTKEERDSYIARYQTVKTIDDIKSMLDNPKYAKFITPATQFTPQVINNLQQNFPELSQKLARVQAYEFSIGGKALTAQEQKILEPLYGWRGLNASQLKKRMEGVQQDFEKRNKLEQEIYPGLKKLDKKFDEVYGETTKPTETKPAETKTPEIPSIPSGVPPTAQYSPSQKKWWWKKPDGTWESK